MPNEGYYCEVEGVHAFAPGWACLSADMSGGTVGHRHPAHLFPLGDAEWVGRQSLSLKAGLQEDCPPEWGLCLSSGWEVGKTSLQSPPSVLPGRSLISGVKGPQKVELVDLSK